VAGGRAQGAAKKAQTGTKQLKKALPGKPSLPKLPKGPAKQVKRAVAAPLKRAVPKTNRQGTRTAGFKKFQGARAPPPTRAGAAPRDRRPSFLSLDMPDSAVCFRRVLRGSAHASMSWCL